MEKNINKISCASYVRNRFHLGLNEHTETVRAADVSLATYFRHGYFKAAIHSSTR